jgi:hypothetical protein
MSMMHFTYCHKIPTGALVTPDKMLDEMYTEFQIKMLFSHEIG